MKKFLLALILISTFVFVTGCSEGIDYTKGVDVINFSFAESSIGTTSHLIPQDLLTKFEYGDNKYFRYTNDGAFYFGDIDKTLMYLEYTDNVYEEAKDYILTEMNLDFSKEKSYNGYVFHFNEDFPHRTYFPHGYLMAGYNDEKNRLVFLGLTSSEKKYPEFECGKTDFGKYLKIVYGEFYDFDA